MHSIVRKLRFIFTCSIFKTLLVYKHICKHAYKHLAGKSNSNIFSPATELCSNAATHVARSLLHIPAFFFFCVFWKWSVTFMEASALGWIEAQFLPDNVCHTCESSSGAMTAEWGSVHSSTAERQLCYERPSTAHRAFLKSMLLRSGQKDKAVMSSVSWRHQWMFLVIFSVLMVQECN